MKRYSIFQKHKAKGNMTWYGRVSESGLFHVVSLGTKKKADAVAWLDLMNALRRFGCFRLSARIADLRMAGNKIFSHMVERNGKHVSEYYMGAKRKLT